MPKRRRHNYKRSRRRLEEFKSRLCLLCCDRTQEKLVVMPCCNAKWLHESCFIHAVETAYYAHDCRCPFCRQQMQPFNADEPFVPIEQPGRVLFPLYHTTYIAGRHLWDRADNEFYDVSFDPQEIPDPEMVLFRPFGWDASMRGLR